MTEYFRVLGLNNIVFDGAPATRNYDLEATPTGMSRVLTRSEILQRLDDLPEEIRSHVLSHSLSIIEVPFKIYGPSGFTDSDLEDRIHDMHETFEDAKLYIATRGNRGTRAQLKFQLDNATQSSYKTIYWGEVDERAARTIFEDSIKCQMMIGLRLTLYCEAYWRLDVSTNLVNAVTVYNHDDAAHNNYVDILAADIPGDVPPLLRVRVVDLEGEKFKFIYLARRATRTPASFVHWREAETATELDNWDPLVSLARSNGSVVEDPAPSLNTSGFARWQVAGASVPHYRGRFAIFASLWTDNIASAEFRSLVRFSAPTTNYLESQWKKLTQVSTWQLLRLGELQLDYSKFGALGGLSQFNVVLEYQKTAGVAAQCDYIFLLPIDESVMRLDGHTAISAAALPDMAEMSEIWEFPWVGLGDSSSHEYYAPANLLGKPLTLQPRRNNRIYFKALSVAVATDPFSAHIDSIKDNGAPATMAELTIDYLAQYISPLE